MLRRVTVKKVKLVNFEIGNTVFDLIMLPASDTYENFKTARGATVAPSIMRTGRRVNLEMMLINEKNAIVQVGVTL